MSSGQEQPISPEQLFQTGRAYWLPPDGHGNGLEALTWAQLARLPRTDAEQVLGLLRDHQIPGWVAPVHRHAPQDKTALLDVWAATIDIDSAEEITMAFLNGLPGDETRAG